MFYRRQLMCSTSSSMPFHTDQALTEHWHFHVLHMVGEAFSVFSIRTGRLTGLAEKRRAASLLAHLLRDNIHGDRVLVVGIGNDSVTPDSLGPNCLEKLSASPDTTPALFTFTPGIFQRTGMDTAELVKAALLTAAADCIVTVDALGALEESSLASVLQITDRGTKPGSGTGNNGVGDITEGTMGVPVISVGVPTVLEKDGLLITTADCDEVIRTYSQVIAWGILQALFGEH